MAKKTIKNTKRDRIDRISELPDCLIHHIFSFLSTKDIARTTVLAKKWSSAAVTYPNLDFDQTWFGQELQLSYMSYDSGIPWWFLDRITMEGKQQKFVKHVNDSLPRFFQSNPSIDKFRLCMILFNFERQREFVDQWVSLVLKFQPKQIILGIPVSSIVSIYRTPQEIFTTTSLTELKLFACYIVLPSATGGVLLHSMKKLSLKECSLDQTVAERILAICPSIEQLSFRRCKGLYQFRVAGVPKLKILKLVTQQDDGQPPKIMSVDLSAPSLESLTLGGDTTDINVVAPHPGLKMLYLKGDENATGTAWFCKIMVQFPTVESLVIEDCRMIDNLTICSEYMKRLVIKNYRDGVRTKICTPNLVSFEYSGYQIPSIQAQAPCCEMKVELLMEEKYEWEEVQEMDVIRKPLNLSWYLHLSKFLMQSKKTKVLTLSVPSAESSFTTENIQGIAAYPTVFDVEGLNLGIEPVDSSSYAPILDGLFWSCHPKTVLVTSGSKSANKFIEFLCRSLMDFNTANCCEGYRTKCWRHNLVSARIAGVLKAEQDNPHFWISHPDKWLPQPPDCVPHHRLVSNNMIKPMFLRIPEVLLTENPVEWETLLKALPKLGGTQIRFALTWA